MRYAELNEEAMTLGAGLDPDTAYEIFKKSYDEQTGHSFSKELFLRRARAWQFYGDQNGFVSVRRQVSGPLKLVGVAGSKLSVVKGLNELQSLNLPLWGAVSLPLSVLAKKRGLIVPHSFPGGAFFIRTLVSTIPASVFGGITPEVTKDGGIVMDVPEVGKVTKYIIGNRQYFAHALKIPAVIEKIKEVPGLKTVLKLMGLSA